MLRNPLQYKIKIFSSNADLPKTAHLEQYKMSASPQKELNLYFPVNSRAFYHWTMKATFLTSNNLTVILQQMVWTVRESNP